MFRDILYLRRPRRVNPFLCKAVATASILRVKRAFKSLFTTAVENSGVRPPQELTTVGTSQL